MKQYAEFPIYYEGENYTIAPYDEAESEYNEKGKQGQDIQIPDENIADNGGVKAGYLAFQALTEESKYQCIPDLPFSANQLFWVTLIYSSKKN